MNTYRNTFLVLASILICSAAAQADSIGPDCATCQGSIYTLTGTLVSETAQTQTWDITLSINTEGYTGTGVAIDAVAIKVIPNFDDISGVATLTDAPGTPASWRIVPGGINAGGCSGNGGGFECADWIASSGPGAAVGSTLSWTFRLIVDSGSLLTDPYAASIKARYVNSSGRKVGALVSEDITLQVPVPEPGFVLLLGIGLGAAASLLSFRRRE